MLKLSGSFPTIHVSGLLIFLWIADVRRQRTKEMVLDTLFFCVLYSATASGHCAFPCQINYYVELFLLCHSCCRACSQWSMLGCIGVGVKLCHLVAVRIGLFDLPLAWVIPAWSPSEQLVTEQVKISSQLRQALWVSRLGARMLRADGDSWMCVPLKWVLPCQWLSFLSELAGLVWVWGLLFNPVLW